MTDMTIVVPTSILKAVAVTAAKKDVRYYLNGVRVQSRAGEPHAHIIGTDGHRLTVAKVECSSEIACDYFLSIAAIKTMNVKKYATISDVGTLCDGITYPHIEDAGIFPDWRRMIPQDVSPAPAALNPDYTGDTVTQAKALGLRAENVIIIPCGVEPAVVHFESRDDIMAIIMPQRYREHDLPDVLSSVIN